MVKSLTWDHLTSRPRITSFPPRDIYHTPSPVRVEAATSAGVQGKNPLQQNSGPPQHEDITLSMMERMPTFSLQPKLPVCSSFTVNILSVVQQAMIGIIMASMFKCWENFTGHRFKSCSNFAGFQNARCQKRWLNELLGDPGDLHFVRIGKYASHSLGIVVPKVA